MYIQTVIAYLPTQYDYFFSLFLDDVLIQFKSWAHWESLRK